MQVAVEVESMAVEVAADVKVQKLSVVEFDHQAAEIQMYLYGN